jgi:hypothetical protein
LLDQKLYFGYNVLTLAKQEQAMTGLDFAELRIGRLFHLNGSDYIKQSSRTARMLCNGRVFYIGKTEYIHPIAY